MNYEAKIGSLWYPVTIEATVNILGRKIHEVYILAFKTFDGRRAMPEDRYQVVLDSDIRETTDDPLETVYPKEK